jgi:small subunit ribosomal protein S20
MNKKQRNRKAVTQNKRNRMVNRKYLSTIKSLFKLFSLKLKQNQDVNNQASVKIESFSLLSRLYSFIDKAVKKKVLHKNTAARKKSKLSFLYSKLETRSV